MPLKIFASGDVVNQLANRDFLDQRMQQIVKNCDISICNFEAPIEHEGQKLIKKAGPHVFQSKESVTYLKNMGFDLVSLANNHIYDYGQIALEKTIKELHSNQIEYIGAGENFEEAYKNKIIDRCGVRVGFVAGAENEFGCLYEEQNRGGYSWIFHPLIEDSIRSLKQEVDSIILIAHAGVEEIDIPIKEWRDRYRRLCDVGVDVVIGHHPHIPQGYEDYHGNLIFYSLGNLYFDTAGFENKKDDSYSVILEFEKDGLKDFEIIYHMKLNNQTCMVKKEDVDFSLERLNLLLQDGYIERNNNISIELFYQYYYGYYTNALDALSRDVSIFKVIKYIIKKIFFKNRNMDKKNLLLLHNIRIDSHRFIAQRALSLISEEMEKK